MKTFKEFTDALRGEIWPSGEAKTLKLSHTKQFMAALTDLQKNIPCLQRYNANSFKKCGRYWEDGATVVDQPNGVVRRVFTIANDEWRDKVQYWSANYWELQRWQKRLWEAVTPANIGLPKLQQGFRFDEGNVDSTIGRARIGIWTIYRHRIYVAPWLQSNETLIVEWDGVKDVWVDADGIDENWWTVDVQEAVKLYVRARHEKDYGDFELGERLDVDYKVKRADLIFQCQKKIEQQKIEHIPEALEYLSQDMVDDDVAPEAAAVQEDAFIGDWGTVGDPTADVVALIEGRNPRNVFTLGDNIYGSSGYPAVDDIWGQYWASRIYPYSGSYDGGSAQSIWATWGNHDWDYGLTIETDFLPGLRGNKRYYSVVSGPVHYFIISSDPRDPDLEYVDANTSTEDSIMGEWLRVNMALSTAKWKVVLMHHPVKTSDVSHAPGAAWMNWPFEAWGANMVLAGHAHNYEEFIVDGIPYIVNGLGGNSIRDFDGVEPGSEYQYNENYGAGFISATCDSLTHKFYSRNGTLIRTVSVDTKGNITSETGDVGSGGSGGGEGGGEEDESMSNQEIIQEAASRGFQMLTPDVDADGIVLSSPVVWSDGSTGTYTMLEKNATFLGVDSWEVTYDRRGKTVTQPTVTRDSNGNIIVNPALVLS